TATSRSLVESQVVYARHGGAWDRAGITSSVARSNSAHITALGVLSGAEYRSIYGTSAVFDGFAVADSDVLIKYTYNGDTDFNGKVDGADYARIDTSFNNQVTQGNIAGWVNGDFDLNGKVDGADYALIDAAFNSQGAALRGTLAVPEPQVVALVGVLVAGFTARRRRSARID